MGDLISRHGVSVWLDNLGYSKLADYVMDEDRFLSAESEKAKWIYNKKHGTFKIFTCSKCGLNMETDGWNYCPNCGADMREGK